MKNFEYYIDEIVDCLMRNENYILCSCFKHLGIPTRKEMKSWLLAEHVGPRKLTKRERAFCEYAQSGYIARDEDEYLYIFTEIPYKTHYDQWECNDTSTCIAYGDELFQFIKWEDDEPYSIEEMLTWEVEG